MYNNCNQVHNGGSTHQPMRKKLFGLGLPRKNYTLHAKNHSNSYVRLLMKSSTLTETSRDGEAGISLSLIAVPTLTAKLGTHLERRETFTTEVLAPGAEETFDVVGRTQIISVLRPIDGRTNEYRLVRTGRKVDDVKNQTFNVLSEYADDQARLKTCDVVDSQGNTLRLVSEARSTNQRKIYKNGWSCVPVEDFEDPEVIGISELFLVKLLNKIEHGKVELDPHMHNFEKYIKFLREMEDNTETRDEKARLINIREAFEVHLEVQRELYFAKMSLNNEARLVLVRVEPRPPLRYLNDEVLLDPLDLNEPRPRLG